MRNSIMLISLSILLICCSTDADIIDGNTVIDDTSDAPAEGMDVDFDTELLNEEVTVYFAQTHVQEPSMEKYGQIRSGIEAYKFKLIGNREALIKVHLTSKEETTLVPNIRVRLELDGESEVLPLISPLKLETYFEKELGKVEHKLDDSFHAIIPKEWIKPGLEATLLIGGEEKQVAHLNVGAPTKIRVNIFDIHYFDNQFTNDFSEEWMDEFKSKFPFSEFEIQIIRDIRFEEFTYPGNSEFPDIRVSSDEEYHDYIGRRWFDVSGAVWNYLRALTEAGGTYYQKEVTFIPIPGGGGKANGNYWGWYKGNIPRVLVHEMGHVFGLQHWNEGVYSERYPYKGDMNGISAPDGGVGPIWGFDLRTNTFIPPTVQDNAIGGIPGQYKQDPMAGGGSGTQENTFFFNHFSSYSAKHMQTMGELKTAVWNESSGNYATWSDETKDYTNVLESNGVTLPTERNIDVYSVMAVLSSATAQAHIVYPPMGPYTSGIIKVFDPRIADDRIKAKQIYCPDGGCDVSIKATQGGEIKYYMLPIAHDPNTIVVDASTITKAINLKASDGEITKVELLYTPDADTNGLSDNPIVFYTWEK